MQRLRLDLDMIQIAVLRNQTEEHIDIREQFRSNWVREQNNGLKSHLLLLLLMAVEGADEVWPGAGLSGGGGGTKWLL